VRFDYSIHDLLFSLLNAIQQLYTTPKLQYDSHYTRIRNSFRMGSEAKVVVRSGYLCLYNLALGYGYHQPTYFGMCIYYKQDFAVKTY